MLMAASSGHVIGIAVAMTNLAGTTGIRSVQLNVVNDGTFTELPTGSGNWFTPTTATVGTQWWVRATTSGSTNTTPSGTFSTWIQLTSGTAWGFSNSLANNEGTGSLGLAWSPDAGTTTVLTTSCSWDVGFSP